jgi:monoamine oxidase
VEGFNAASKEDVSVAWLNSESVASAEIDGDRSFRVLSGYIAVAAQLARGLDIHYSTPVRRIRWKRGEAIAVTDRGEIAAPRMIVTVPLAVIGAGGLPIEPEPQALKAARAAIAPGQAIRITFRFPDARWLNSRLSFVHGDAAFPVWWTPYPALAPIITGWAAGPRALALHRKSEGELTAIALASLRTVLGHDPGTPLASYFHDWRADPWARAAYSYVRVNGMDAQRAFSLPIDGTLCFAGEAVAPAGHIGTVHGAIASGVAAARAVVTNV